MGVFDLGKTDPTTDDRTRVDPNDYIIAAFNNSAKEMADQNRIVMRELVQTYGKAAEYESFTVNVAPGPPVLLAGFDLSRMKMHVRAQGNNVYIGKREAIAGGNAGYLLANGSDLELTQIDDVYAMLSPDRTDIANYITNGSFETGTVGWSTGTAWTASQSSAVATSGGYSMQLVRNTATAGNGFVYTTITGLVPGQQYALAFDMYAPAATSYQVAGPFAAVTFTSVGGWKRYYFPFTAQATTTQLYLTDDSNAAPTNGSTIYLDSVQVNKGALALPYADGSATGYGWTGQANQSMAYYATPVPVSVWIEKSAQ